MVVLHGLIFAMLGQIKARHAQPWIGWVACVFTLRPVTSDIERVIQPMERLEAVCRNRIMDSNVHPSANVFVMLDIHVNVIRGAIPSHHSREHGHQ